MADDATLEFPTIYASGRQGIATTDLNVPAKDFGPLYDIMYRYCAAEDRIYGSS